MKEKNNVEDEYPHWRTALFGNHNAVANIRCAIHYVFWHASYALIGVIGVLLVGLVHVASAAATYLGPVGRPIIRLLSWLDDLIVRAISHEHADTVGMALSVILLGVMVVLIGYLVYLNPIEVLIAAGIVIASIVLLVVLAIVIEYIERKGKSAASHAANGARRVGEKAVETPGIRRVYGQCPVSMDQAPKWFDNLFDEEDEY